MANSDLLTCVEFALRDSIAAESFDEADRLLEWYALTLDREVRVLDPGSRTLFEYQTRVNALLEWAGARIDVFRACTASEAAHLRSLTVYERQPAAAGAD